MLNISKEELKKTPWFHNINPGELNGIEEYAEWLEAILHNACSVWEEDDGELVLLEIRQLVVRVDGLKIEIYSNEHPPPHFHVKSPNVNASFSIEGCEHLKGEISRGDLKKIEYWHRRAKPLLVEHWNKSRPTNCTVGAYVGT